MFPLIVTSLRFTGSMRYNHQYCSGFSGMLFARVHWIDCERREPGSVFCLLLRVKLRLCSTNHRPGYLSNPPCEGRVTVVTCPVIGRAQPGLSPSKIQKTGPDRPLWNCNGILKNTNVSTTPVMCSKKYVDVHISLTEPCREHHRWEGSVGFRFWSPLARFRKPL